VRMMVLGEGGIVGFGSVLFSGGLIVWFVWFKIHGAALVSMFGCVPLAKSAPHEHITSLGACRGRCCEYVHMCT